MRCLECDCETEEARGWRGYLIDDPEDDEAPSVVFYCPECADREFGLLRPNDS
jgi:hypothetical protein